MGEDSNMASRVEREVWCPGAADPVLGCYARLHWSISDAEMSEVLGQGSITSPAPEPLS